MIPTDSASVGKWPLFHSQIHGLNIKLRKSNQIYYKLDRFDNNILYGLGIISLSQEWLSPSVPVLYFFGKWTWLSGAHSIRQALWPLERNQKEPLLFAYGFKYVLSSLEPQGNLCFSFYIYSLEERCISFPSAFQAPQKQSINNRPQSIIRGSWKLKTTAGSTFNPLPASTKL